MTPKEKAVFLLNRTAQYRDWWGANLSKKVARRVAIDIADEVLHLIYDEKLQHLGERDHLNVHLEYWNEVKEEIQKL